MNKEAVAKIWDSIYRYDLNNVEEEEITPYLGIREISDTFEREGITRVLDVGCGRGDNLIFFSSQGFDVVGTDISSTAVSICQRRYSKIIGRNPPPKVLTCSFSALPFKVKSFEGVIAVKVLQHGYRKDIEEGFREIRRIIVDGGLFFFTVPGRTDREGRLRFCLVKTAKRVDDKVYIPTQGKEKGIPHFIFNKKNILDFLRIFGFKPETIGQDSDNYYKVLARAV